MKEINQVCRQCGVSANVLTCLKKYKHPPKQLEFEISTYYKGKCDVCEEWTLCSEPRDFFFPDFSLLLKKMK